MPNPPPAPGPDEPAVPYDPIGQQQQAAADHTQAAADHAQARVPSTTTNTTNYAARNIGWREGLAVLVAATIGFGVGQVVHTPVATQTPQSAGARDPFVQPFTSTSIWNQPIGSSAVYVASGIAPPTIQTLTVDSTYIIQDPTAPLVQVQQNGGQHSNTCSGSGTLATDPIPAALVVPSSAHNNEAAIVQADGQTIDEGGGFSRCVAGGPAAAGHLAAYGTLFGDGVTGGTGGSRLSTLGGTLRPGELAPGKTEIPHALRVNIDGPHDLWPGTTATCFRWPATKCDSYGPSGGNNTAYGGHVKATRMGALLAIPPAFDCSTLSPAGQELCRTLQDYGAYVGNDAARSVFTITSEEGDASAATQFQSDWGFPLATSGSSPWASDVQKLIANLSVIDNNGPNNIGGGGTPRQPLAPPLSTTCLTAIHLTAATPAFDPDGDGDDDFVDPPTVAATPTPTPAPTATPTQPPTPPPTASPCPTPTPTLSGTPTPSPTGSPTPTATPTPTPAAGAPHVMVVIEENKGYQATLGTCSADPYFCSLAASYASYTNAHGLSHPSQPNYYGITSGSLQGCSSDTCPPFGAPSLGSQLNSAGVQWQAWMESMPSACDKSNAGGYVLKHSPFVMSTAVGPTCANHVTPYPGASGAVSALTGANAPQFVWITPNLTNDMHDGTVQQGDAWLKANVGPILASSWFTNFHSTVIVTMDEGPSANQIPTVVISNVSKGHGAIATNVNHYSALRAIEETFGLSLLGGAATAADLRGSFG